MKTLRSMSLALLLAAVVVGCSSSAETTRLAELEAELQASEARMSQLENNLEQAQSERQRVEGQVQARERELAEARQRAEQAEAAARNASSTTTTTTTGGMMSASSGMDLLPPDAQAGECYARLLIPAVIETTTEQVVVREAGVRIEMTEPVFEMQTEQILIAEESEEIVQTIPARYETRTERVEVKPASFRLEEVAAQYETVTEQVLVKPARKVWKPSQGRIYGAATIGGASILTDENGRQITRLDSNTGELMCLVEEPAEYKTVTKRVLRSPATTRRVEIPAEYETVSRRVMVEAPQVVRRTIPAKYETITKRVMVTPPQERRIDIPAEYGTVTKETVTKEAQLAWMPVLCEVNVTVETLRNLQNALKSAGYYAGPIDGIFGRQTMEGIDAYQKANNMVSGGLTAETLDALGVTYLR